MACEVEIFGQKYVLRSDADEEHVRMVADLVDGKMREVAGASRSVSTQQIAVLAALDLASEVIQGRNLVEQLGAEVAARSEQMTQRISHLVPEVATP